MAKLTPSVGAADHVQGSPEARLTLVEYGDYQCPSCGQAYPIVKQLQRLFGERLRFVFRNFPLEQHPMAEPAAEAAEFAASQGKFWEMHDALFENQRDLAPELFASLAADLKLDPKELDKALQQGTFAERVAQDLQSGEDSGVTGTPTFYINGKRHDGSFSLGDLEKALEAADRA